MRFQVGQIVQHRNRYGDVALVQYRGQIDGLAVVIMGCLQMSVPTHELSEPELPPEIRARNGRRSVPAFQH